MIEYLYQQPLFYAAVGIVAGVGLLHVRAQGAQAWARNLWMLLILSLAGGATSFLVARISPDYGSVVVFYGLLAAWAVSWVLFGLLALWRNNVVIGLDLDPKFVRAAIGVVVAAVGVYLIVNDVQHDDAAYAYLAVPSLAGAIHRLLLVVEFLRLPVHDRESMGRRIDRRLRGEKDEEERPRRRTRTEDTKEKARSSRSEDEEDQSMIFNPLDVRS